MENNTKLIVNNFEVIMTSIKLEFISWAPKIVNAIVILIIGVILAYFFKWLSKKLVRVSISFLPRSIKNKNLIKDNLAFFILGAGRVLFILIIFLSATTSLKVLGMHVISNWLQSIGNHLPNLLGSILIVILGWKMKGFVQETVNSALSNANIKYSLLVSRITAWSLFTISLLIALQQVGLDLSLIITISTVILAAALFGVALMFSLGAKDSISDILYCFQINRVIKVGSTIKLRDFEGVVKSIGPVFVIIESQEGLVSIPGKLISSEIMTVSKGRKS
jgi:hypothetical protein